MSRYKIVDGSESAHCCFNATVVDTAKPMFFPGSGKPITRYNGDQEEQCCETICECFTMADAELVCRALNALAN